MNNRTCRIKKSGWTCWPLWSVLVLEGGWNITQWGGYVDISTITSHKEDLVSLFPSRPEEGPLWTDCHFKVLSLRGDRETEKQGVYTARQRQLSPLSIASRNTQARRVFLGVQNNTTLLVHACKRKLKKWITWSCCGFPSWKAGYTAGSVMTPSDLCVNEANHGQIGVELNYSPCESSRAARRSVCRDV